MALFLDQHGLNLDSLNLGGHFRLTENFWVHCFPRIRNIRFFTLLKNYLKKLNSRKNSSEQW